MYLSSKVIAYRREIPIVVLEKSDIYLKIGNSKNRFLKDLTKYLICIDPNQWEWKPFEIELVGGNTKKFEVKQKNVEVKKDQDDGEFPSFIFATVIKGASGKETVLPFVSYKDKACVETLDALDSTGLSSTNWFEQQWKRLQNEKNELWEKWEQFDQFLE